MAPVYCEAYSALEKDGPATVSRYNAQNTRKEKKKGLQSGGATQNGAWRASVWQSGHRRGV